MANNISASNWEELVEERLIAGLVTGSFLQNKELLDMLEDVDVQYMRKKTLLHVGVTLGKADWVEELLARGADPDLVDDTQWNALSSAEEMVRRFPEDVDRSLVLKLVTLVHRRDQVTLRRLEASSSRSTDNFTPMASPECDIESLMSSVDTLRQEMKSLVCQLSSSLEELKAKVGGCDTQLRCLGEAMTSTAEDVTSIKFGLGGESSVETSLPDPAKARQECVDRMLRRTMIVFGDGVDLMRCLYERLYDEDDCTACIIKYLSGDDRVKVMVDFESECIGRMKEELVDLDGRNGSQWYSGYDFESEIVYLAAKDCSGDGEKYICARLAGALSRLSLKLVFDNEWRPYSKGDAEQEREWMRALEEVEEEGRKRGEELDWLIRDALKRRTQLARVNYLAAAVPRIITFYGSTEGRSILQLQAPILLPLYSNNVMPTLLAKVER
ncbi:uncharacterized protein LOC124173117 [Ischnura elegans]|uniref:uncharacterized protein LOC124173117 n=1 Tax=Ischnura elegans TaxID=197161 RepID=UPI001ED8A26A|nr:uncharacterized protein LOC124173117 [Ischnura elegans]